MLERVGQDQVGGSTGKELLVQAARSLFAERGVDGASLRQVARAAGQRNTNAVQYHFGERESLVAAVLGPVEALVGARRAALLDELELVDEPSMRVIAGALVRPSASLLETLEGREHLRILAELIGDYPRFERNTAGCGNNLLRWSNVAKSKMPSSTLPLHRRYAAMSLCFGELGKRSTVERRADDRLFISDLIDLATGVLVAPVSEETERLLAEREA